MGDFERQIFLKKIGLRDMAKVEKEKFLRTFETKEEILRCFQQVRKTIERSCGIKLSNIEGVGLRKITEACVKQAVQDGIDEVSGPYMIEPHDEAFNRFLYHFYNVPAKWI